MCLYVVDMYDFINIFAFDLLRKLRYGESQADAEMILY